VSAETCAEAPHPSVPGRHGQIILNCFRQKPLDVQLAARAAGVGIIARVPFASGHSRRRRRDDHLPRRDHRIVFRTASLLRGDLLGVPFMAGPRRRADRAAA
jgi:hypothetical protein